MNQETINTEQGHWLLAKMGKKVLRPGGKELTLKLVNGLNVGGQDNFIEFAPGIGFTASYILKKQPKSYIGIELNGEAATNLKRKFSGKNIRIVNSNAANSGLESVCANKVLGEAMLTMQANHRKQEIIKEAYRLLKPGGLYGIHELALVPDGLDSGIKAKIQQELAKTLKVNARPLTQKEWCYLLENEGFKVRETYLNPMHLMERSRMIADEGLFGTVKIGFNVLTHPKARRKMLAMQKIFRTYQNQITAIAIVAEKK